MTTGPFGEAEGRYTIKYVSDDCMALVCKLIQPGNRVGESDSFVVVKVKPLFIILGVWGGFTN